MWGCFSSSSRTAPTRVGLCREDVLSYSGAMPALRFVRHEQFIRQYIKTGGNGVQAYMRIYPNASYDAARSSAGRLMGRPYIRARYHEVLDKMVKKIDITIEKIINDYQYALDLAKEQGRPAEIVSAATAQAKICDLLRERLKIEQSDSPENISDIIQQVGEIVGVDAAAGLVRAFKLDKSDDQIAAEDGQQDLAKIEVPTNSVN